MSWGVATNGSTWNHQTLTNCEAIDPTASPPPPSGLTGHPFVGRIDHSANLDANSVSTLAIAPFPSSTNKFELRGKVWFEMAGAGGGATIWLSPTSYVPYIRLDITVSSSTGFLRLVLTTNNGSSSRTSYTSVQTSGTTGTWLNVLVRGARSSNAIEAWVGSLYVSNAMLTDTSGNIQSWTTPSPSGVVEGLIGASNMQLRLDTTSYSYSATRTYAFDQFSMSILENVQQQTSGGTPLYGHICQTFKPAPSTITLGSRFAPGSCEVWVNGVYTPNFTENTSTNSISLGFTPQPTDTILVCYLAVGPWA